LAHSLAIKVVLLSEMDHDMVKCVKLHSPSTVVCFKYCKVDVTTQYMH